MRLESFYFVCKEIVGHAGRNAAAASGWPTPRPAKIVPVERDDAGDPNDSLPIGAPLPDFAIPDIGGRVVRFENLLAENKPFLFFFVGSRLRFRARP